MDIQEISKLPFFFIIGRPRSGTTLLRTLFDAHTNVIIPQESPVILNLYQKYSKKDKWTKRDIEAFYEDIKGQNILGIWDIDKAELRKQLLSCSGITTFQTLIKVLYSNYQSIYEKHAPIIVGDKNPVYSYNFGPVFKIYQEAKYIHLTRDYRDQLVSMNKMDFELPSPALMALRWKLSVKNIIKFKDKYPKQFFTIKYEDLVMDPDSQLKKICRFLNIEFQPEMLNFYKKEDNKDFLPSETMDKYHTSLFNPINTSKIGVWKTKLNDNEVKISDMVVGKYAEIACYERVYKKFNVLIFITVLPALLYGYFWAINTRIINVLPFKIKMALKKMSPLFPYLYSKLRMQNKNQKLV